MTTPLSSPCQLPLFPGKGILSALAIAKGNHLLHWTKERVAYHLSFRLADSVPLTQLRQWEAERRTLDLMQQRGLGLRKEDVLRLKYLHSEKVEEYLDAGHGACLLAKPGVAEILVSMFRKGEAMGKIRLHAYGIMPNHVHVILELCEGISLKEVVQSWKSSSSHSINKLLERSGTLWQTDYFNRIIRTAREYAFQVNYVFRNDMVSSWRRQQQ